MEKEGKLALVPRSDLTGAGSADVSDEVAAAEDAQTWDAYNWLLGGPDTERIRKMVARLEFVRMTERVPGDVVEAGVFKGTGFVYWLKLLQIFSPGSLKRVVGFDLFEGFAESAAVHEQATVRALQEETQFTGNTPSHVYAMAQRAGFGQDRCELVAGDVRETALAYAEGNPGFRISILHLDLDLAEPTSAVLDAFWPRVVSGGVVVFDEYAVPKWTESHGVDAWLDRHGLVLETMPWMRTPSAFVRKR